MERDSSRSANRWLLLGLGIETTPFSSSKSSRKLATIQDLRALAALGVVIAHGRVWQLFNFDGQETIGIWANVAQAAPDLFFVVSGFILMNSTWRPLDGWRGLRDFLTRRFFRIYPTYWAVGIPVLLVWWWNPSLWSPYLVKDSNSLTGYFISSIFLIPQTHSTILVVAWTVIYEVYFYLVVSFIFLLDLKSRLVASSLWGIAILSLNVSPFLHQDPLWRVITSPLGLEFIAGIFLAAAYRMELPRLRGSVAIVVCVLAFSLIICATMIYTEIGYFFDRHRWRVFCFGPPAVSIIAMSLWMEKQGGWTTLGKLSFIGDRSYSLYLLHVPVFQLVFRFVLCFQPHPSRLIITSATLVALGILVPLTELLYQKVELRYIRLGSLRRGKAVFGVTSLSNKAVGE